MPRVKRRASKVITSYRRVHRTETGKGTLKGKKSVFRTKEGDRIIEVQRSLESLWHDRTPPGWNFLDWFRAWNDGWPMREHVDLYNSLWPDDEDRHIALDGDDE